MFTGIIEDTGVIVNLNKEGTNLHFTIESEIASELKPDQSVAHNGVCLTVVSALGNRYSVTAVDETLQKTNLGKSKIKDIVNLERSILLTSRVDGHFVQGHVDGMCMIKKIEDKNGSHLFTFDIGKNDQGLLVQKGSVCINGVSLTVVDCGRRFFSVAIIPYTFNHTNFKFLKEGDFVNLEFDIIGKYVSKMLESKK
ncbi:MAG: riboflavin synthase [Bacteroidia bacterium]